MESAVPITPQPEDPPKDKERRSRPRSQTQTFVPLTLDETALYEQQKLRMREMFQNSADAELAQAELEYNTGAFCNTVKSTGYWKRDPAHRNKQFPRFIQTVTHIKSRQSAERRMHLAIMVMPSISSSV